MMTMISVDQILLMQIYSLSNPIQDLRSKFSLSTSQPQSGLIPQSKSLSESHTFSCLSSRQSLPVGLRSITSLTSQGFDFQGSPDRNSQNKQTIEEISRKYNELKSKHPTNDSEVRGPIKMAETQVKSLQGVDKQELTARCKLNSYSPKSRPEQQNQLSPILKGKCWLEDTQPETNSPSLRLNFAGLKTDKAESVEAMSPCSFTNYKLAESCLYYLNKNEELKIQESVVLERSVLDSFKRISSENSEQKGYREYLGVEKELGFLVSIKQIEIEGRLGMIANEARVMECIGNKCPQVLQTYAGFICQSKYVVIREPYLTTLENTKEVWDEGKIVSLISQLLDLFECLIDLKFQYKESLMKNICVAQDGYKLKNFESCLVKEEISESVLRRKYLKMLKVLLSELLGIDCRKPYYSERLRRDLEPRMVGFISMLGRNQVGFSDLRKNIAGTE